MPATSDNTFLTPETIARQAYANLFENTVLAQLVHRDYSGDFDGQVGDTITVRKPATFEAKEWDRATGIEEQDATESGIAVKLDTVLDVSFEVTSMQWTLDIANFNEQLLEPATEAIAQGIDRKILSLREDVTETVEYDASQAGRSLIRVGEKLNEKNVPMSERRAVLTTGAAADFLEDSLFHQADQRGDTAGLIEANIGRKFAFDTYMSQNANRKLVDEYGEDIDGTDQSVAFHRTAFAFVSRTLAIPRGAPNAATFGADGFGIRVTYDYDQNLKRDVVSLDVLIGVKTLDANRAVLIDKNGS